MKKPVGCAECPLVSKGRGWCPDKQTNPSPEYLFIGETPDKNEIEAKNPEPFIGKSGFVLKNWLIRAVPDIQLAAEKGKIKYANTLRCLPPDVAGRAYPKGEERVMAEACCRQYDAIPESVKTVVLFGEAPQRVWFKPELDDEDSAARRLGRDTPGVMGRVGREYEKDGIRWVLAPHPAAILRQPSLVQHGQMSLRIAANTEEAIEPGYWKWNDAMKELNVPEIT